MLAAGRRRGQVRAGGDLGVVVDAVYGAIHYRLLLSRAPIDGPFVSGLVDLVVIGVAGSAASQC